MTKVKKQRVDLLLVEQGLAKSRAQAQALVMSGAVCLGDQLIHKPSELFEPTVHFRLKEGSLPKYVSRGGDKLEGALKQTCIDPKDFVCLDVGSSTGGFTDCLLQHGAKKIYALDVGHNQLDFTLRQDNRVELHEGVNARELPDDFLSEKVDLIVVDVSFISLTLVLKPALKFMKPKGVLLALIKPQFEVGKGLVGKGGIVKDPLLHAEVQGKIKKYLEELEFKKISTFSSSIEGADGNKEFFVFATRS